MAATEPIRNKQQLQDMAEYFRSRGEFRNYNLVVLGVYTALRIGDLLQLRWTDVYDEKRQRFDPYPGFCVSLPARPCRKARLPRNGIMIEYKQESVVHERHALLFAS